MPNKKNSAIKRVVLLVDDSKTFQSLLMQALQDINIDCIACESGQEAMKRLNIDQFDLVCSTFHLVDMTGIELCQKARDLQHYCHKPFVLLTTAHDNQIMLQALSLGVTDVFQKKDIAELLAFIRRFPYLHNQLSGSVLYVEDTRSQREFVTALLCKMGLVVDAFASAEEAWQQFLCHEYDVVLADIALSAEMSCPQLVSRIRRLPDHRGDTPILTITAFDDQSRQMELLGLGVNDYMVKPVNEIDLFIRINRMIGKKNMLSKLSEQQENFRISFEHAAIGIAKVSVEGYFLHVNPYWVDFLGYSHAELLTLKFQDITYPEDLQFSLECLERLLKGEVDNCSHEKRYVHKNGEIVWGSLTLSIRRDDRNRPLYFISAVQDVTESKQLRDQIGVAYEQYRHILATSSDGFFMVARDGHIEDVNDAYLQMTGYTRQELITKHLSDVEAMETPEQTQEHIAKIIRDKQDLFETVHRTKKGGLVDLEISVTYQESTGKFISFLRDIGVRKKLLTHETQARQEAEASLQRAIRAEKQLLKVCEETYRRIGQELHDDVGQQITAVALLSEILTKELKDQENPLAEQAHKITRRLNMAVSRTRKLSHGLCPISTDYRDLFGLLSLLTEETSGVQGIICQLNYDVYPESPVYFDYGDAMVEEFNLQLYRIAQEAVTNAVKHSKASRIDLILRHDKKGDMLEIKDNGIGFKQATNTNSGLGMFSMSFRARVAGLQITFLSNEDDGVCVGITLPRC